MDKDIARILAISKYMYVKVSDDETLFSKRLRDMRRCSCVLDKDQCLFCAEQQLVDGRMKYGPSDKQSHALG